MGSAERFPTLPTASFREEHAEIAALLGDVRDQVGSLRAWRPRQAKARMTYVVGFLQRRLRTHADWEERVLYPLADERARSPEHHPFTAALRAGHAFMGRAIDWLSTEAARPRPDVREFVRRADALLGAIEAHFDAEEHVLLPLLDATMTREEFERVAGGEEAVLHPH